MTDTPTAPARASRPARDEGQWALGSTTPLNANEEFKVADNGLNVRERIETIYSREGFASIPADDLRGRMRWWGLYTQRRPGIDGGRTASLPPEELDDEYFMLRIRSDGGALSSEQARTIAGISTEFARGTADITDRQNIQLHWIRIEDVPEIWRRLEAVGLSSTEACGDTPRVVLGSPVAGVAADEIIDGTPAIDAIVARYVGDPEYANLPRKFKSAISGSPRHDVAHEINDVSFVGVVHPEHGPGFDVWVGGGLSTNPMLAQRLGAWVPLDEVPEVWGGIIEIFRDYGYRRLRNRARLKFLVADWGAARFREVLETQYLQRPLHRRAGAGPRPRRGARPRRDPPAARRPGLRGCGADRRADQRRDARAAGRPGRRVRLRADPADRPAEAGDPRRGARAGRGSRRRVGRASACRCTRTRSGARRWPAPGSSSASWRSSNTKDTARTLIDDHRGAPTRPGRARWPCTSTAAPTRAPASRWPTSGSRGCSSPTPAGTPVEGFQVHLGGSLGHAAGFGRKLRALKVTAAELPDFVDRVAGRYLEQRTEGEQFAEWVVRADEEALR